jgi:outer membrane protein TolC
VIQAESLAAQSVLTLQETGLAIDVEVRRASASLDEATELVAATKKTGEQAEEALRVAEVRRGAGSATQLEVLQAQSALTTARTNQLRAVHGYNAAAAQLRRAIGVSEITVSANDLQPAGP